MEDWRVLIDSAAEEGWYLASTSDSPAPLAIEPQAGAFPVGLLPDEGRSLEGASVSEAARRHE